VVAETHSSIRTPARLARDRKGEWYPCLFLLSSNPALPVNPSCVTCMDAKAFTDMVARTEETFMRTVREAEQKQ